MLAKRFSKILFFVLALLFLTNAGQVRASFGFSPGALRNQHLSPGAHFEQTITFSRYSPEGDLKMEVTIDAPEIEGWLSIDRGLNFIFPDGKQQTSMVVLVDVPRDAGYGEYKGFIRVRAIPTGEAGEGAVSVVVGGDIRIDLAVTREQFSDFRVRTFGLTGLTGKNVKVFVNLENLGNVPVAPSKVHLEVYDEHFNLLYSADISDLEKVAAFETGSTVAEFPFQLAKGYYWGEVEIFKNGEVVKSGKVYFEVAEKESLFSKVAKIGEGKGRVTIIGLAITLFLAGLFFIFRKRIIQRKK